MLENISELHDGNVYIGGSDIATVIITQGVERVEGSCSQPARPPPLHPAKLSCSTRYDDVTTLICVDIEA